MNYNLYDESAFAERLQELMFEKDLNQSELAEKINVKSSTISRYLSEQKIPEVEMLVRLANFFNCSVNFLVGRSENYLNPRHLLQGMSYFFISI